MIIDNDILDELIINFDETSLPVLPVQSYAVNVRGSTDVKITGVKDKRNVTGVIGAARDGTRLPWQLIYKGGSLQEKHIHLMSFYVYQVETRHQYTSGYR